MNKEIEQFNNVANELCKLHEEKNASYGNAFTNVLREFGDKGIYHATGQMCAKMERIKQMVKNDDLNTFGESIDDAIKDLVCYGIMTLAVRKEIVENRMKEFANNQGVVSIDDNQGEVSVDNHPQRGDLYQCNVDRLGLTIGNKYTIIKAEGNSVWLKDDDGDIRDFSIKSFDISFKRVCKKEKQ